VLTHIDNAVGALKQFRSKAVSDHQRHSSAECQSVSLSPAACSPHDTLLSSPPSPGSSLLSKSLQSLSAGLTVELPSIEEGPLQSSTSFHSFSLTLAGCSRCGAMVSTPSPSSSLLTVSVQSIHQSKEFYMEPNIASTSEKTPSSGIMMVDAQGSVGGGPCESPTSCHSTSPAAGLQCNALVSPVAMPSPSSSSVQSCGGLSPVTAQASVGAVPHESVGCDMSVSLVTSTPASGNSRLTRSMHSPVTTTPSPSNSRLTRSMQRSLSPGEKFEVQGLVGGLGGKLHQSLICQTPLAVAMTPSSSNSRFTRSMIRSLSPAVKAQLLDLVRGGGGPCQAVSGHSRSLPSSPFTTLLLVDLCMPRRYVSLSHLSSRQQLSTVTVSPDLLCDRLKRKRISHSSQSFLINHCLIPTKRVPRRYNSLEYLSSQQQRTSTIAASPDTPRAISKQNRKSLRSNIRRVPAKYQDFVSSYFNRFVGDNSDKDRKAATSACLPDNPLTDGSQTYKSSDELMIGRTSGDCYLTDGLDVADDDDDAKLTSNTDTSPASAPLPGGQQCSLNSQEDHTDLADGDAGLKCNMLPGSVSPANAHQSSLEMISTPVSLRDQLLLSLQAIENGRSCNISLCYKDRIDCFTPQTRHNCRLVANLTILSLFFTFSFSKFFGDVATLDRQTIQNFVDNDGCKRLSKVQITKALLCEL